MSGAAGLRGPRQPDRLDPPDAKAPSNTLHGELGQAEALEQSDACNKAAVERYSQELQDFFAKNKFIEVSFPVRRGLGGRLQ